MTGKSLILTVNTMLKLWFIVRIRLCPLMSHVKLSEQCIKMSFCSCYFWRGIKGSIRHLPDKSIRHLVKSALGQLDTNHWLIRHNFSCFLFQWVDSPDTSCMLTNWFNPVYVPVPSFRNTPTILVILVL
jgi:hypothetical protein